MQHSTWFGLTRWRIVLALGADRPYNCVLDQERHDSGAERLELGESGISATSGRTAPDLLWGKRGAHKGAAAGPGFYLIPAGF